MGGLQKQNHEFSFLFQTQSFPDVMRSPSESHLTQASYEAVLHIHLLGIFVLLPTWGSKATFLDVLLALVISEGPYLLS